ncbi:MAG: ferredoxin reductase [Candidatus Binatia bacterium]
MPLPSKSSSEPSLLKGLLSSPWLRPLNDTAAIDDFLGLVSPTLSLTRIRARVVAARRETADTRTLVLQPNRLWPGHRSGQHVLVEVEIDGRRLRRTFSLSSPPRADGLVSITVKKREGGKVSVWWNDAARVGDVITLGAPAGDFVLPSLLPPRLVLLSAGSGITPLMAMLRELAGSRHHSEVLFVHAARCREETIFAHELEETARQDPRVVLRMRCSASEGRLDGEAMAALALEAGDDPVFACGPSGFVDAIRRAWTARGRADRLHFESFGFPPRVVHDGVAQPITAAAARTTFTAQAGQSLLEAAEAAGLTPVHGCRMGVCHMCKCRKVSGVVRDLRDGHLSGEPGQMIQLCISTAASPVTLEL